MHTVSIVLSKKWDVPTGPAKGHLDTQLFEECKGTWCDRDIVKKNRRRRKLKTASSNNKGVQFSQVPIGGTFHTGIGKGMGMNKDVSQVTFHRKESKSKAVIVKADWAPRMVGTIVSLSPHAFVWEMSIPEYDTRKGLSKESSSAAKASDPDPRIKMISIEEGGIEVWIVDGDLVRTKLEEEFTNFGQHYRFDCIPKDEFWIDEEAASDESKYYIKHLLVEYDLMSDGMEYDKAIVKADAAEKKERGKDDKEETEDDIHRSILGKTEDGATVWEVDGSVVRDLRDIDFTEGGHDRVYDFVPVNEVWIDDEIVEKERPYILLHELHERGLMGEGMDYEAAHKKSSALEHKCRENPDGLSKALKDEGWNGKVTESGLGKEASALPSIDQMISSYANAYASQAKDTQLVKDMVPANKVETFNLDGAKLADRWRNAVERFFLIYPQREHNKWSLVKTALIGRDWTAYPEAKKLCYAFLIPATVKCIKECLIMSEAEDYVSHEDQPNWIPVESSIIKDVLYHEDLGFLDIRLKDDKKFTFRNVSKADYDNFMSSPSKGQMFNKMLKERKAGSSNWYVIAMAGNVDMESVTREQWDEISRRLCANGYDIRGADDVKRIYVKNFNGKPKGLHKSIFDAVVHGKEYLKEHKPEVVNKAFSRAIKYFGVTHDMREAGYILPDGTLLDLSGKKEGAMPGRRALDHREVDQDVVRTKSEPGENHSSMVAFIQMGAIRYFPEHPGVDMRKVPTRKQLAIISSDVSNSGRGYSLELSDPKQGRFSKWYEPGTNWQKVITDIVNYYGIS